MVLTECLFHRSAALAWAIRRIRWYRLLFLAALAAGACSVASRAPVARPVDPDDRSSVERLRIGGAEVRVDIAPQITWVSRQALIQWVRTAATAVSGYYGHFPVRQVTIAVLAGGEGRIGGGEALGSRSIRVQIGRQTRASDLHDDWVLTHEMFHLGFPDLPSEYLWMNEGLADYLEPVARCRIGNLTATQMWKQMVEGIPDGLPQSSDQGLDRTHTWGRTYWGGTLFWLLADVRIRQQTANRRSVDDAVRAILDAGGNGSTRWRLSDVLETGNRATGTSILTDLHAQMGLHPWAPDLEALWSRLGIQYGSTAVTLVDTAPLSGIRRAITDPAANPPQKRTNAAD